MGRITAEVSNEIGLKLPEACPLHKHKVYCNIASEIYYYKHRVGTDDEIADGKQCAKWNVSYPSGGNIIITSVINGTCSSYYGDNITITSDSVASLSSHETEVIVNTRRPNWVLDSESGPHWYPTSVGYSGGTYRANYWYTKYYKDSEYSDFTKTVYDPDLYETITIPKNPYKKSRSVSYSVQGHTNTITQSGNPNGIDEEEEEKKS